MSMGARPSSCECKACHSGFKKMFWDKLYPIKITDKLQEPPKISLGFQLPTSKYNPPHGFLVNHNNLELKRTIKELIPEGYKFSRKATRVVKPREIVQLLKRSKSKFCKKNLKTGLVTCNFDDS